jgi:mono/diheme cytochrome c family protein
MDPPGNVARGEALVEEKQCLSCHSIRGVGGDVGSDLTDTNGPPTSVAILRSMFDHAAKMSETV